MDPKNEKKIDNTDKNQTYSGTLKTKDNEVISEKKEKMIMVQFKENRKFDLHIGRNIITFYGREIKPIPANWLKHNDWQNIKNYFFVKGV